MSGGINVSDFLNIYHMIFFRQWICRRFTTQLNSRKPKVSKLMLEVIGNNLTKPKRPPTQLKREIDALQAQYPDHVLLVQCGMFYEIYNQEWVDDLSVKLNLNIANAKITKASDHRYTRYIGFPMFELNKYLKQLFALDKSVAVVKQLPVHPTSEAITRRIDRIYTKGTVLDEDSEMMGENNFMLSIYHEKGKSLGLAWLDVSTGEFFTQSSTLVDLPNQLAKIQPKEVLIEQDLDKQEIMGPLIDSKCLVTKKPSECFRSAQSHEYLAQTTVNYNPSNLVLGTNTKMILKKFTNAQKYAAAALITYVKEIFPAQAPSVRAPLEIDSEETMRLDVTTIQALEITKSVRENTTKGSLLSIINKVQTASGRRLLITRLSNDS